MEESGHEGYHATRKKAELEKLWPANTAQELRIAGMVGYHAALHLLHEKVQDNCNIKI